MGSSSRPGSSVCLCALVCVFGSTMAAADLIGPTIIIEAVNDAGAGQYVVTPAEQSYDADTGTWEWGLSDPLEIWDPSSQSLIATMESGTFLFDGEGQVNLSFSVTAGDTDTMFQIISSMLPVDPPMSPAEGYASAAFTVTDFDGDGATLTGNAGADGNKSYLAHYNGFVPDGTAFAELIQAVAATPWSTADLFENHPPAGYAPIAEPVADMSAMVSFVLTADDLASGTTNFVIIPEAGALGLLLLGAIGLRRRR